MTTLEKVCYLKEKGITLKTIAERAKTSLPTLSNWISGKKIISSHLENSIEYAIQQIKEDIEKCV